VNRIGRIAIFAAGQSTLNSIRVFWSWAFGARLLAYGQL
jgi:hypothetical protein